MLSFVTTAMNFMAVKFLSSSTGNDGFQWGEEGKGFIYLKSLIDALHTILWPLLIVVASIATIYAIYIGVMMAKAEDAGERDKFKSRIINVVIAMAITVVIILLLQLVVVPNLQGWLES